MKELYEEASQVIGARTVWEQKQRLYDQMRHDGLRRRTKPFPAAADLHFPLVDMNIRKGKPFWQAQATSQERLASFVALQQQEQAITTAAADFFDWEIKQNTNYLVELIRAIDGMCLRGRGVLKVVTDPFADHKIECEAVNPLFILMSEWADDFEDADFFVHVQHWSLARYKRNRLFSQNPDVIHSIVGNKDLDVSSGWLTDKELREGVNYTRNPNQILLWEHYVKTMGGWTVYTYSPMDPRASVRRPFGVPYKFRGKQSLNFFSFKMEVKDRGWYSPRGMGELGSHFEQYCCKLWNEKADAMTFGNRPVFTSETPIPQTASIRWVPGEFIPGNIRSVPMAPPAISFDQEIAFARGTSEQQNMLPDFGITRPGESTGQGGPRTATENNRIATLQTVGTDSNGFIFRLDLAKVYRHMWALMLQFRRPQLIYYAGNELKELPEQALHEAYLIQPDGSADDWNKPQRLQRAMQRLQMYKGDPNCNQDVLKRDTMAADDPKFALEAFVPTNEAAASEAEDEAMEIVIMEQGFPAQVRPEEDHVTRIHVLLSWLQAQGMKGRAVDPTAMQRVQQHLAVHWQDLKQLDPQKAAQLKQQIMAAEQQPQGRPGQGGLPGQGNGNGNANPGSGQPGPGGVPTGNPS